MKTGIEIIGDYDKIKDFRDYEKFKYKKWYSKEEIIKLISVRSVTEGERILSLDKSVKFLNELMSDEE